MSKLFICLVSLILSSSQALAEIVSVHSVLPADTETMVKLDDGRVVYIESSETLGIQDVRILEGKIVDLELSEDFSITTLKIIGRKPLALMSHPDNISLPKQNYSYQLTVYNSYQDATAAMNAFRRNTLRNAQCYDKAHIWSYEENYHYGTRLGKAFLFFSDSYIRRYRYQWWFHVAPYGLIRMNGNVVERIMDAGYYGSPLQAKVWTDMFMKNKAQCKVVGKYSDYSQHPGEDDCYIIKASMYFWQPKDLEAFEASGIQKTKFIDWEIRHAYREGFGLQVQ